MVNLLINYVLININKFNFLFLTMRGHGTSQIDDGF